MAGFADVDTLVASFHQRGGQPGLAYGVVVDGELVHASGLGERALGGPAPDAATVFRIASMTKSFTASAVLALRDDGVLGLDDPAGAYVPELRGWPPVSPDAAPISIRHLLTMTAGFPTDDPWGDRQQGLPLEDFAAFLARGVRSACPAPATRPRSSTRSRPRAAWPAATGAGRAAGRRCRSSRAARSPRWAASSAACGISAAGWRASPQRSRPSARRPAARIRSVAPPAGKCSCP